LYQADINHLYKYIKSNGNEAVIKSLLTKKSPDQVDLLPNSTKSFKEKLISMIFKNVHKMKREGMPTNTKSSITLIQKLDKDTTYKIKLQTNANILNIIVSD
jgi:hypothetical protein